MNYLSMMIFLAGVTTAGQSVAQPYYPKDDNEVVEQLPARGESWLEIRALRRQVAEAPNDLPAALRLVRRYIELGRAESDPRYFGYAEAALSPWLAAAQPNPEVLILRATLLQNRHDFAPALAYLNQALQQQPRLAQAWLTRASIYEVQGQYAEALHSCLPLLQTALQLAAQVCINSTLSLSGQIDNAYRNLRQAVAAASAESTDRQWALTTLAEIAERRGDPAAAEQHFQEAVALQRRNGYLLATYADFLLTQRRYAEVVALLKSETRADGLLLRLAMAEQQLRSPEAESQIAALQARFAASRLRGDTSHQGDEARFLLHVLHQADPALALAQANWAVQREPRDAKILLEAALAAGRNVGDVRQALNFLKQAGLQDVRLAALIERLPGGAV